MGVPFYFKSIINHHPHVVHDNLCQKKVQRLFVDFNSIIHQAANDLMKKNIDNQHQPFEDQVIHDAINYIDKITSIIKPQLVYIAVDGLCPRAKMNQQRKRRYITKWRNQKINECKSKHNVPFFKDWDSNCITPGTKFMEKLDTQLIVWSKKVYPYEVEVSCSNVIGEGEHKIFQFLKALPKFKKHETNVIYGLDADLIMLSLISNYSDTLYLMRERPVFDLRLKQDKGDFLYLNIFVLKHSIYATYRPYFVDEIEKNQLILDYVILCALLGNDFIPPLSYLKIKQDGIHLLLTQYASRLHTGYLVENNQVNLKTLIQVLSSLSTYEDKFFNDIYQSYNKKEARINLDHSLLPHQQLEIQLDNYPLLHKFPQHLINMNTSSWKSSYYHHVLDVQDTNQINMICDAYLEGILWVTKYYLEYENASLSWYYTFNHSPLLSDFLARLLTLSHGSSLLSKIQKAISVTDKAFLELQTDSTLQLLMVLPPQSVKLLPKHVRSLMTNIQSKCCHFFPISFQISTFLKHYLWECSPTLPDIDIDYLVKHYHVHINQNKEQSPS